MSKNVLSHARGEKWACLVLLLLLLWLLQVGAASCKTTAFTVVYLFYYICIYFTDTYITLTNSNDFLDITEEAERPADLSQPIVFKQRHKPTKVESECDKSKAKKSDKSEKSRKKSKASSASKLSFNEDEEDADADED